MWYVPGSGSLSNVFCRPSAEQKPLKIKLDLSIQRSTLAEAAAAAAAVVAAAAAG